ncbi:MAG: early nodulin 20 (N-20) [Lachnospiraceae bacterium]|nr:early nodulin 20 (N-20) [Lachnospiraceae bacterium]
MRETLKLVKPLKINGTERTKLDYDIEEITGEQFDEADTRAAAKTVELGRYKMTIAETDNTFQKYLGMMAIIAVNPEIDIADLERIKGVDLMNVMRIGRNFTKGTAEEEEKMEEVSEENSSEELTEHTQESTTQESNISKDNL